MRTGHPTTETKTLRFGRQVFNVTRVWVVRFITMHINEQIAFGRYFAEATH